jgi:hypothetical protein
VLKAQLLALLEIRAQRNVEIQIMPTSFGYHPGLNGPMVLLETAEHRHVGYIESQDVGVVISDPEKVSALRAPVWQAPHGGFQCRGIGTSHRTAAGEL